MSLNSPVSPRAWMRWLLLSACLSLLPAAAWAATGAAPGAAPGAVDAPLVRISDGDLRALVQRQIDFPDRLNPKLWDGMTLRPEVRERALKVAQTLFDEMRPPGLRFQDILLLGSSASFEYDSASDIDVHIVIDPASYNGDPALLERYLEAMNDINEDKFNVRFYGHHVDFAFYLSDVAGRLELGAGVYSLTGNRWLAEPRVNSAHYSAEQIFADSRRFIDAYNDLATRFAEQRKGFDCSRFAALRKELRVYRRQGMIGTGIRSTANITYRLLRRVDFNMLRAMENQQQECLDLNDSLP